ncbi:hypothetical protein [Streptomyces sp. NPDC020377]|uniref:hypothetical protein n=1 Tax=Streptomyces sp. NPDC020377 TaxID=3365070 RepID=UPI0037A4F2A9
MSLSSGLQLRPVDVRNPERRNKLASTLTCGWADTFVAFDSASAEKLWDSVERGAYAAFEAVYAGTPFADPLHVEALRDLVVLHYVRSHRYRSVYTKAFETVSVKLRSQLVRQYPEQLRREALRQTRLHLAGSGSLGAFAERLIERSEVAQEFENGKLFRTSIEGMFHKVRAAAAKWHLEVLTLESGQLLGMPSPLASSPPTRGSSGQQGYVVEVGHVLPSHAVLRWRSRHFRPGSCPPRRRGGVPSGWGSGRLEPWSSPPTPG